MDNKIDLNLINCTRDQCLEFAEKILNDEFEEKELKSYFEGYSDDYSEEDAINIMKNIIIIKCHLNISKVTFLAYSGRLLLNIADCVEIVANTNFKILYGLCLSQFNEEQTSFKDDACDEVISEILLRFSCLVGNDEKYEANFLKKKLRELNEKDPKFHIVC